MMLGTVKGKILGIYLLMLLAIPVYSQAEKWQKLVPLESTRTDVESILGEPEVQLENYGTYLTKIGRFSVWYSNGACDCKIESVQWNVPAGRLTSILFYPSKGLSLENYVTSLDEFTKSNFPPESARFLYTSKDGATNYQTIVKSDSSEFVYTIELRPNHNKDHILCKNLKKH